MSRRPHLATLLGDMARLGAQTAVVEHRGVRRYPTPYAQLVQGACWFAAELEGRRIAPGARVLLWGENSAAWIAAYFGCVLRGVLAVPLDAAGGPAFAQRILAETTPQLIVGDAVLLQALPSATPRLALAELDEAMHHGARPSADWQALAAPELGPDTPLQILFTSGTTGEPKGIVHTHRNLLASLIPLEQEIAKYRRYERLVHPLRQLHTLPLSHVFGQFMGLWIAPMLGMVVHYESRLDAPRLLRLLRQERISVLAAVPRMLSLLRAELIDTHPTLPQALSAASGARIWQRWWRLRRVHRLLGYRFWAIVCGGATLPPVLEEFWTTLGIALIQGYGMTETSALVTLNHPFKPARGTLGKALPGRELRVTASGELLVRGDMVASTLWRGGRLQPAAEARGGEEDAGWLATGDLARRDEQGRLHYLGRTGQRLVTAAGLNVYLEDVEAALTAQPGVRAALAVGVEGAHGAQPGAVLLAENAERAGEAVMRANEQLAPHQRIVRWWLWPGLDLPRTATGKVRRAAVEAWVAERIAAENLPAPPGGVDPHAEAAPDPLLDAIATLTANGPQPAQPGIAPDDATLESLGLDSLGRVQLQVTLERAAGRSFDDAAVASARTLGDLRALSGLPHPRPAPGAPAETAREPQIKAASTPPVQDLGGSAPPPDRQAHFRYPRWPWSAPLRLLRLLFLEACVRPLVWLLAAPRVLRQPGASSLLVAAPMLIVANHVTSYDAPLLLYALPPAMRRRVAIAAAGEMLEDWRHGRPNPLGPAIYWLLTALFNVFPLPRSHAFRAAFAHAGQALDNGYSVLIFPEGTRSHANLVQPFRGGIGLLAQQAGVPLLPVGLVELRVPLQRSARRRYRVTICVGEPLTISPGDDAHAITTQAEQAVRRLVAQARAV